MSGWNLPPGCTEADIDRAMGGEVVCSVCAAELDTDAEMVWWRGRKRPACSRCAARAEDED